VGTSWELEDVQDVHPPVGITYEAPSVATAGEDVDMTDVPQQSIDAECSDEDNAQEEGDMDVDFEELWPSSGSSGDEAPAASLVPALQPKSASVLIVGSSTWHGGAPAVLLGGATGRCPSYRYCDFGGGLDGGPWRHGGRAHSAAEKAEPHRGAFRELAEEFLGLHGDDARRQAEVLWRVASGALIGGAPVHYKHHLMYIVTAESLIAPLCEESKLRELSPHYSAIDILTTIFKQNSEVYDVALIGIRDLVESVRGDALLMKPLSPIWGCCGRSGGLYMYPLDVARELERLQHSAESLAMEKEGTRYIISPQSPEMVQVNQHTGYRRKVFRWDQVSLRHSMRGSISACSSLLLSLF